MNTDTVGCFISIPKCASKTILDMFKLGHNRDNHFSEKSEQCIIYENHKRLKLLENKYNLTGKYIFAFVRHPYDRVISWFYYHIDNDTYKSFTLNEWVKAGCKTHWRVQNGTNWAKEGLSPLLQYNFIDGKSKVDYIGKFENFDEDCKTIVSDLNDRLHPEHPKRITYKNIIKNKTKQIKKDVLTDESKEVIYNLFKKDFDYFQYDK